MPNAAAERVLAGAGDGFPEAVVDGIKFSSTSSYDDKGETHHLPRWSYMKRRLWRNLVSVLAGLMLNIGAQRLHAEERLVFISAFAAGDKGAIHAYQFDLASGKMKLVHRVTNVENPFFLTISRDQSYLY